MTLYRYLSGQLLGFDRESGQLVSAQDWTTAMAVARSRRWIISVNGIFLPHLELAILRQLEAL